MVGEDFRESIDDRVRGPFEWNACRGIQWNDVDLGFHPGQQFREAVRVVRRVVDAREEYVLERDAAAFAKRKPLAGLDDLSDAILPIDRHELAAQPVVW